MEQEGAIRDFADGEDRGSAKGCCHLLRVLLIDGIATDIYDDEIELRIDHIDCCDRSTFARDDGADLCYGLKLRFSFDPYRDRVSGGSVHLTSKSFYTTP